jgi:hypothetical protein
MTMEDTDVSAFCEDKDRSYEEHCGSDFCPVCATTEELVGCYPYIRMNTDLRHLVVLETTGVDTAALLEDFETYLDATEHPAVGVILFQSGPSWISMSEWTV